MRYEMASLLPTSVSLGLWYSDSEQQRLIVLDLARLRICIGLHLSAFFWHGCVIFFFCCSRAIACNRSKIRHCRAFFSCYWTHTSHQLIEVCFFAPYLCWNTAETLPSCSMLLRFSSFSHNLPLFSPSLSLRDYPWTLSLCSILTVSNS